MNTKTTLKQLLLLVKSKKLLRRLIQKLLRHNYVTSELDHYNYFKKLLC